MILLEFLENKSSFNFHSLYIVLPFVEIQVVYVAPNLRELYRSFVGLPDLVVFDFSLKLRVSNSLSWVEWFLA